MGPKSMHKNQFIFGAFVLTIAGLFSRFVGFFYRIFLSNQLGAEGMGLYQLIFPIYGISISLCCSSIQTGLSRFIAGGIHKHGAKKDRTYFQCALFLSMSLALFSALALHIFADTIALHILNDTRCTPLLRMLSLAIPVCAVHSCIVGYYYGQQKTTIPATSQIVEQIIRMSAIFLFYRIAHTGGQTFQVIHAVYGLVIGEIGALVYCMICFGPLWAKNSQRTLSETAIVSPSGNDFCSCMGELISLVLPMTANRLCLSLLQSGESIMIPDRLRLFGLSQNDALSLFGTLTGMALPFILFPSTLINSLAVMLLPEVANAQAAGNQTRIRQTSGISIHLSLTLGILCLGVFRHFGIALGTVIFGNELAGNYITQMSFLCPFLYLAVTLASIINGLGNTKTTFINTLLSLCIRLGVVFFFMPTMGINAYFYGLLISEILLTALHLRYLYRSGSVRINLTESVLKPAITLLPITLTTAFLERLLDTKTHLTELPINLLSGAWFVCGFLGIIYLWREKGSDE